MPLAREREGERARESACDGDDEEIGEASRRRSFTVESKTFELALEDRKGKCQVRVVEKKRGVSTWVRLGLDSLGLFKEGLIHCIRDEKEGRWEKEWKEKGRRDKRGWTAMAEMVCQMEELAGRRTELQEVRTVGKIIPAKSYAEAVRRTDRVSLNAIKMKVTREEIAGKLKKLEHCLVASWKSNEKEEDDLERLGTTCGLFGEQTDGRSHLRLDRWNPKTGCRVEEEMEQVAWVKIFGLPISLWSQEILKKIGEECGGFLDMDERTRSMSEIQWARILVKTKDRPVVRRLFSATENRRKKEVRGDSHSRAEKRVGKELVGAGNEDLQLPDDGRAVQENGQGPAHGRMDGSAACGPNLGLYGLEKDGGPNKIDGLLGWPNCSQEKAGLLGWFSSRKGTLSEDPLMSLVLEEPRREQRDVGLSMTDRVLEEEAKRYASFPILKANGLRGDMSTWLTVYEGNVENVDGSWKLGEVNKNSDVARGKEGNNSGFEGLEKEILSFLTKIRKRREKIQRQGEPVDSCPMKMKIITWNVRGANDSSKRKIIKNYIRNQRVDLMCIQETKIQEMSEGIVRNLGSGRFLDWRALNAEGATGGILICWDKRVLEILDWKEGQFSLSCRFKTIENGATWVFTGVYGPFTKVERKGMWEELGAIRGLWDDPWCLGGDFNITLFQHERSSQRRTSSAMRRFAEFVDDLELVDLPLQGGEFTWSGGLNNQAWARLDRFLVSPSWLDQFSGVTQGRLSRPTSDHFPIVLEGGGIRRGPPRSDSKICGLRLRDLMTLLEPGGKELKSGAALVIDWPSK
ncbi:hypothetical protein CK203_013310 [Vitis vinifera]|uniref:Endonuclease/exonuclease/phosphatase domain-containing protein n=1 Tax=Vitis vinifera TaxID=29760 RepID=A0A438JPS4_VITVI|nr:hypothetical protein CK203_013310 [Vitis vinifera]